MLARRKLVYKCSLASSQIAYTKSNIQISQHCKMARKGSRGSSILYEHVIRGHEKHSVSAPPWTCLSLVLRHTFGEQHCLLSLQYRLDNMEIVQYKQRWRPGQKRLKQHLLQAHLCRRRGIGIFGNTTQMWTFSKIQVIFQHQLGRMCQCRWPGIPSGRRALCAKRH